MPILAKSPAGTVTGLWGSAFVRLPNGKLKPLSMGDKVKVHIPSEHSELAGLDAQAEVVRVNTLEDGRQALGLAIISMT